MADVFDNQVPKEWRRDLFELINECRRLDWLLLTKRPQDTRKMLPSDWREGYRNLWLGTTTEDQARFDQRWKHLVAAAAAVRFISYEPAAGPLRLPRHGESPDWLISGGESGPGARRAEPKWVRDVIADCHRHGVAPFHKQWGIYGSNPLVVEGGLTAAAAERIDSYGKGGGLVDGELVREFPSCRRASERDAA
jgi:protein gp37